MAKKYDLEHYLRQLRKIEEHREQGCEQNVRRLYQELLTDLEGFLGETYSELAENDMLTYEILHAKGKYAKFLETVDKKVDNISPEIANRIRGVIEDTYEAAYDGMVKAVKKSSTYGVLKSSLKGLRAVTPDVVKRAIENPISGLTLNDTLEKNRQTIIYDIKQAIGVGLSQGDRMSTMARRITEKVDMSYRKAIRIVRTETHRVREAGYQDASERVSQALRDSGSDYVMTKTWKTMQDEAVRPQRRYKTKKGWKTSGRTTGPNHMKMHGVTVLVDEKFDLGGGIMTLAPGQSGVAGHDINCRCYLVRDLMTKAEYSALTGKTIEESAIDKLRKEEQRLVAEQEQLLQDREDAIDEAAALSLKSFKVDGDDVTIHDYISNSLWYDDERAYYAHMVDVTNADDIAKMLADLDVDASDAAKSLGKYFEQKLGPTVARQYGLTADYLVKYESRDIDTLKKHITNMTKRLHDDMQPKLDEINELINAAKRHQALQLKIDKIDFDLANISDDLVLLSENGPYFSSLTKEPGITDDLKKIIGGTKGELTGLDFRVKEFDSYKRKVKKEVGELQERFDKLGIKYKVTAEDAALQIRDTVRYTCVSDVEDFLDTYEDTIDALKDAGYEVVRVKNTFKPGESYKGVNTIVRSPDGFEFELQFHTKQSFELKNGILHDLYEQERDVGTSLAKKKALREEMQKISDSIVLPKGIDKIESFDDLSEFLDLKLDSVFNGVQFKKNEIDDLSKQISKLKQTAKSPRDIKIDYLGIGEPHTAEEYLKGGYVKSAIDERWNYMQKRIADGKSFDKSIYDEYERFFSELAELENDDITKQIKSLEDVLKIKKTELKGLEKDLDTLANAKINAMRKDFVGDIEDLEKEIEKFSSKYLKDLAGKPRTASAAKVLDKLQDLAEDFDGPIDDMLYDFSQALNMSKDEARKMVTEMITEIVDECDVGMRIEPDALMKVLSDDSDLSGFKNLFEVGTGGGCTNQNVRRSGEYRVFNIPNDTAVGDRPIYGMMIPKLDDSASAAAKRYVLDGPGDHYGGITVVLDKKKIANNAAFTLGDSLDNSYRLVGSAFNNPMFTGTNTDFLDEFVDAIGMDGTGNDKLLTAFPWTYMEVQVFGKDNHGRDIIEKVYVGKKYADKYPELLMRLDELGIPYEIL